MFRRVPYGSNIAPACSYCAFGSPAPDGKMVLCTRRGVVSPYYSCRRFQYAPLKRRPRGVRLLPKYRPEDFEL